MNIYHVINRHNQITVGVCDSLAAAQAHASGLAGRILNWSESVCEDGDEIALNWLSDDYKYDIAQTHLITYEDALNTWRIYSNE